MYIQQSDLFQGLGKRFLKDVMAITMKESYGKGAILFHEGDPALHAYVLLKGRVDLILGETGNVVFVASRPGEAFGWSSLIGRDVYSATAECREPTRLLKMHRDEFQKVLEQDPASGSIFFRHLAASLGSRLLQSYKQISASYQVESSPSLGTGQIRELEAAQ